MKESLTGILKSGCFMQSADEVDDTKMRIVFSVLLQPDGGEMSEQAAFDVSLTLL